MANIKSAKKRVLVQAKREARNKACRSNLKTVIKQANAAIAANAENKDALVKTAQPERNPLLLLWQNSFFAANFLDLPKAK